MRHIFKPTVASAFLSVSSMAAYADANCDASCQAARKAANPLADVRAIMTDNTVSFKTGTNNEDSYNFQLQPVYAVPLEGANLVLRGIIPIQGVQPGAALPPGISGPTPNTDLEWGIGDSTVQAFYAPTATGNIAYGFGAQVSLPTHTKASLEGPGWGAGPAAVVFGQSGDLSWGAVLAHMWGENNYSTTILQPIVNYGLGSGWYIGYNNVVSYNWKAPNNDEAWQVPLGLMVGRTIVTNEESGTAVDVNVGYYTVNRSPTGGPDRQFKFGLSFFF
ncbi:hypothetical protein TRL7639_00473 [Falsiruegeria litorea R37]|uniref:Neuromedin U n=2 Tax=Falsiruegeria litorea TaxID=1280831 RepID=A0A1Y5RMH5_9RHOB|nr:hypothetical protein TRL7639_00473 [Falsiruegeria litorea R37]